MGGPPQGYGQPPPGQQYRGPPPNQQMQYPPPNMYQQSGPPMQFNQHNMSPGFGPPGQNFNQQPQQGIPNIESIENGIMFNFYKNCFSFVSDF